MPQIGGMFDAHLHPLSRAICDRLARPLHERRISATAMSLAGFLIGMMAVPAIASGFHGAGLALILTNRLADGLDGALARRQGPSARGAFLDITLDFFFYGSVPFAFALADPASNAIAAALLLLGFIGTGSSFLAFESLAARTGQTNPAYGPKGIYYLEGLTEGAETIGFFIAFCLWPAHFALLANIFAGLCLVTTLLRWKRGFDHFSK